MRERSRLKSTITGRDTTYRLRLWTEGRGPTGPEPLELAALLSLALRRGSLPSTGAVLRGSRGDPVVMVVVVVLDPGAA